MKIALCFLTTADYHFNIKMLKQQIKKSVLHDIDLYIYVDNNNKNHYTKCGNTIYFHYSYFRHIFNWNVEYYNDGSAIAFKSGMEFLPLLDMYNNHKNEYDMYMFWEDDLSYFGKENIFDSIDFNCDAIFQDKRLLVSDDNWFWWYKAEHKIDESIIKILYHGLLNIYALKGNIIDSLFEFIKNGNYVEHEMLISAFVLNNNYNVNYINNYIKCWLKYEDSAPITNEYDLIHPVKQIRKYNKIKYLHNKK